MRVIEQQVVRARKRLLANVLLERLSMGALLAAGLCGVVILTVRLLALNVPSWQVAGVSAAVGGLFTVVVTWLRRPTELQAAVALDQAARLKERISTALVVQGSGDPFARAAVRDAEKLAGSVHVPTHLRLEVPPLWPWSAAAVLAATLLAWLMPTVNLFGSRQEPGPTIPRAEVEAEHKVIKTELEARLEGIKELTRDHPNLKDLAEQITPLEMPDTPAVTPEDIRREAVKRIDAVGEKLRRELTDAEYDPLKEMKRMLQQLQPLGGDRADSRLSQALASGDFEGAKEVLKQMGAEIKEAAQNAADPAAREKLEQMRQQLERLAEQIASLGDDVQLQKELENTAGLSEEEARKLLESLAKTDPKQLEKELQKQLGGKCSADQIRRIARKIEQKQKARQACRNLSSSLKKAAGACAQCNGPGAGGDSASVASNALSDAASMLSDLELSEQMLNELEARLSDLENLRHDICQGKCNQPSGRFSNRIRPQGPNAGLGFGSRVGQEATPYKRDPTKAPTRFQGGTIIGQMLIDGPQVRGEATAEVMNAAASAVRDALDAIEREEVPRQYRQVVQEYFESLAGLVGEKPQSGGQ